MLARVVERLSGNAGLAPLLEGATLHDDGGDAVTLHFPDHARSSATMLDRGDRPAALAGALVEVLGREVAVKLEVAEPVATAERPPGAYAEVPPRDRPDDRPEKPDPAKVGPPPPSVGGSPGGPVDVDDDPLVKAVIDELGATVVKVE